MKSRLYMETTIPSVLTARPSKLPSTVAMQQSTKFWWERRLSDFEIYISAEVIREASAGDSERARARLQVLESFTILPLTAAVIQLRDAIMNLGFIPPKAAADALHLAVSAAHGMDFLLTWNCAHINNGEHEKILQRICWAHGTELPVIVTPDQLMPPAL